MQSEAEEEIGLNLDSMLDPDNWYEEVIKGCLIRLYIVQNISESTKFETKTRFELKNVMGSSLRRFPTRGLEKVQFGPSLFAGIVATWGCVKVSLKTQENRILRCMKK